MGGKGGGGVDTSGLEEATNRSIDLQKEIFDLTREDVQPWYQMGVGATDKLSDLLGISGGSVQSREDIYNDLSPQYTTTTPAQNDGMYVTNNGLVVDMNNREQYYNRYANKFNLDGINKDVFGIAGGKYDTGDFDYLEQLGWKPMAATSAVSTTDHDALNTAVEERLAQQGETPEGFGSLLERFDMDKFEVDPGYQFRQDESNKALERSMAAQGVTLGGAGYGDINPSAMRASQELNQNLASQEYGNSYNRYVQDNLNTFNMLTGASGMGQGSTGILATGGQNYATNVGNLTTGLASAQLNADLQNQSSGSMFGNLLGSVSPLYSGATGQGNATQMALSAFMSDDNVKENIVELGQENGHDLIEFNYKGDDKRWVGVSAQRVQKTNPEAVVSISGILHVDYDRIGIKMRAA